MAAVLTHGGREMSDPMADLMAADDAIDALPAIDVMDLYVRAKFMRAMMDHYGSHPNGFSTDGFREAEKALTDFSKDGVRSWAIKPSRRGILAGWVKREASMNRSEDFIIAVFNRLTSAEKYDREKRVRVARGWLKDHLSGSLGMPDDKVIRENLKRGGE